MSISIAHKLLDAKEMTLKWAKGLPVSFPDCHDWETADKRKQLAFLNEPPKIIVCKNCGKEKKLDLTPSQMKKRVFCDEKCFILWRNQKSVNNGVGIKGGLR